jgi:hypothetical protein
VNRRGVCYDVGTVYSGLGWKINTRRRFDPEVTRRELEIIKTELHCNAVRIVGNDIGRLTQAAEAALKLDLEVWLSPALYDKSPDQTLDYYLAAAQAAEHLRRTHTPPPTEPPSGAPASGAAGSSGPGPGAAGPDAAGSSGLAAERLGEPCESGAHAGEPCAAGESAVRAGEPSASGEAPAAAHGHAAGGPDSTDSEPLCQDCPGALCLRSRLRNRPQVSGRIVFCIGGELSLFMRGIVPGRSIPERVANMIAQAKAGDSAHTDLLNSFLARAGQALRGVFGGPVTYASLIGESVDWTPFDFVGLDHYRDTRIKDRYADMLLPFFGCGKPVVVTEVGMRGYRGAEGSGTLGFGVIDQRSQYLHQLPLVGRLVRARLNGEYVRDEGLQARELADILAILDSAGVDGVFVSSFVEPLAPFSDDPRYDLDMSALSLVKSYETRRGTTFPDMPWDPKEAFKAVAASYAPHPANV